MGIKGVNFIVVDVETTGSHPDKNRLTEIACVVVRDGEIRDKFTSLVNPHQFIPQYIANMTGISNEMAFRAPEAADVLPQARKYFELENSIFVAHNVKFDWGFVQSSLKRVKLPEIDIPMLCTLKLARKILPKEIKKNVGALADFFGVTVTDRHRALGDAEATAYILIEMLDILEQEHDLTEADEILEFQNKISKNYRLNTEITSMFREISAEMPTSSGVFYFKNEEGKTLYLRQADNLRGRFIELSLYGKASSKKFAQAIEETVSIEWKQSPNVLSSLVLQKREIDAHNPRYNIETYRNKRYLAITNEDFPRIIKTADQNIDAKILLGPYESNQVLDKLIMNLNKRYKLRECSDSLKPDPSFPTCFLYDIHRCNAPCAGHESKEEYQIHVEKTIQYLQAIETSRIKQENLNLMVQNGTSSEEIKKSLTQSNGSNSNGSASSKADLVYIEESPDNKSIFDVYFIKNGRLINSLSIGKKASLSKLKDKADKVFYQEGLGLDDFPQENSDEYKIINKWIKRNSHRSILIPVSDKKASELFMEIEKNIHNFASV